MPLTFLEALAFAEQRNVKLPDEYANLHGVAKNRAFSIAGVAARDQLQGVLDSLLAVQKEGLTFQQWKDRVTSGEINLGLPDHRLDNIFRTNMQVHYNAGHWAQQQRMKRLRPYLMYDAVNDSRTRPSHLSLDNVIRPVDDPFWETHYTPNGYRCRCTTISMTEDQANARGGVTPEPPEGWQKPDKGWDYNPGADPDKGIAESGAPKQGSSHALQGALESRPHPTSVAATPATKAELLDYLAGNDVASSLRQAQQSLANKMAAQGWDQRSLGWRLEKIISEDMPDTVSGYYIRDKVTISSSIKGSSARSVLAHELGHHIDHTVLTSQPMLRQTLLDEFTATKEALAEAGVKLKALVKANDLSGISAALVKADLKVVSPYAMMNESEWIAESICFYIEKPALLELVSLKIFAALERLRLWEGL